jgi:flagellar motor switch protein FliM
MTSKDVLSEGELDALMDSVSEGDISLEDTGTGSSCRTFDFSTREQALLAQMPALKNINEKHALALALGIQKQYKIHSQVGLDEVRLVKLDQALNSIKGPSGINLIKVAPLNGVSFVVLPGKLLSFFVDNFFGGALGGSHEESARKSLTPTERRINDVLTEGFMLTLKEAWSEKVTLNPELSSFETNSDFLQAGSPDDQALLFSFSVKVGEWQSAIDWIVPYAAMEPLRKKLGISGTDLQPPQTSSHWEAHFRRGLAQVELEVSGVFAPSQVSISEVLNFKPGSIVPLKMPTQVTVFIEGQPFSSGEHGVLNGNKSIKIMEMIKNDVDYA